MPFPSQEHATKISDRLNVLADQLKTRTRASLTDANHWLESVMKRFFNALMGWDLVNLNAEQANFPAADLGDKERRIAIQITNQNDPDKITETAAKAAKHELHKAFDRLIIFFLLSEKPSTPKRFAQPPNGPTIECWDLADLLKLMPDLPDQSRLETANHVLAEALGLSNGDESTYISNLPGMYANCVFVGRDSFLDDLRASLLKKTHATAIMQAPAATGISGLGGIGKTHSAVEYAHRHQPDYTATLFLSGDSPDRLASSFSALFDILPLGGKDEVERDQSQRVAAVMKWLASHEGWLLIVDNVDDENAAAALNGYMGHLGKGHVLITSCLQNWADNIEPLPITYLSRDASIELLLQLTDKKRRRTDDEAEQVRLLAEKMDGLPLALHQAAGYINEQRLTFRDYIAIYEHEAAELLGWFKNHVIHYERLDKDTPKPVLITWKTSFDKLDPDTRFWLLVFAHFAPDPIPEFLLDSAADAADEVKTRHRAARQALAQAENYSLLTRDRDQPRFKLHRLVQHILRLTAPESDRTAALAIGIQLFVENDLGEPTDVRTWPQWTSLQAHAVSLTAHAPDAPAPERLSWLLNQLGVLLDTKSLHAEAELNYYRALMLDEAHYGPHHPDVAIDLNNLAQLFNTTKQLAKAEPLIRRALVIDEACYGPDHPNVARDLNNLAELLRITNRLTEAETLIRRALEIDEASYSPDHPNIAIRLNNLALLLQSTNRLAEAEILMRRALSIDEVGYDPNHPMVAIRLSNLAVLLQAMNQLTEAEPLMRRALDINESSYGPDHFHVARDLNNLAMLLRETNRPIEAEMLIHRALKINEICFGPKHPTVSSSLNNLAQLLHDANRFAEAEPMMRRALGIDEANYGPDHPDVACRLNNLAQLLQASGRPTEAEPLIKRALDIDETSYGRDHPTVAIRLNNFASLLQATNRLTEAEPLMRRALCILVRSQGLKHPNSKGVGGNYIELLQAMQLPKEEIGARVRGVVREAQG
jgi:tetratricopeptide (TPR) repeat protein